MSEKLSSTAALPDGKQPVPQPLGTGVPALPAGNAGSDKAPASAGLQPPVAPAKPPVLFGGHKGGGKKRADGLVAGSAEAIKVDKEKDAARKRDERAAKKNASLPPTLPGVASAPGNAPSPVASGVPAVPVAPVVAGAPVVGGSMPTFVLWSATMLARPIKLLTKIIDRFRCSALMEKVRSLGFDKDTEKEIEQRLRYKAEQIEDFNAALTNCAVIELNKRKVPGAQHSHWLELAMTTGELVNCHLDTVDFLEKKLLEKAEREKPKAA